MPGRVSSLVPEDTFLVENLMGQGIEGVLFYPLFLAPLRKALSVGHVRLKSCPLLADVVV